MYVKFWMKLVPYWCENRLNSYKIAQDIGGVKRPWKKITIFDWPQIDLSFGVIGPSGPFKCSFYV